MGIVWMGPPPGLVDALRTSCSLKVFVEAGTYMGRTARWASRDFERVITIEAAPALYEAARRRHAAVSNIRFIQGRSDEVLRQLAGELKEPSLVWLDAHWSGRETFGEEQETPIVKEIEAICSGACQHHVLVDDIRFVLAPPPAPHDPARWPDIAAVLRAFERAQPGRFHAIIEDVLVSVPAAGRSVAVDYCRHAQDAEERRRGRGRWLEWLTPTGFRSLLRRHT